MKIPIPFGAAYVLLLLALPGVWLLARALTCAITSDRSLRAVLPWSLGLCLWLSGVHAMSLATGALSKGLPSATIALSLAGLLAVWLQRRRGAPVPATGSSPSPWMWLSMAATAALLAPAAFRFWFHDELPYFGHMSTAAAMQNDIYPPRHLLFPEIPFRYHYGFDLLSACLTALLRLQVDRAIDVATVLLWCVSWCLFWVLGERLVGRRGAWLTPLLALFAGGIPVDCDRPDPSLWHRVVVECGAGTRSVNAPVTSYFFQHPWGLGIPVAVTIALLLTERQPVSATWRLFALWLAMALLSLSEITLFFAVLPAAIVAETRYAGAFELRRGAVLLGVATLSVGAAWLMGGFFAHAPGVAPLQWQLHGGFADDLNGTLAWNAKTFGLLLPLGLAGFFVLRAERWLWASLVLGSLVIVNSVRVVGSDDIMKFATVASLALGVLASAALARLLTRGWAMTAAVVLAVGSTAVGGAFLIAFALDVPAIPAVSRREPDRLPREEIDAMTFVRARLRPGELVYHRKDDADGWCQWGGVPQPRRSWADGLFGLESTRLHFRSALLADLPADIQAYRAQGFAWLVLSAGDEKLVGVADAWIRDGTAREAGRFGSLRVVALTRE